MANDTESNESDDWRRLPVTHVFPDGQRLQFANHITVQHSNEGEFILSFFELAPPVFLGQEDEIKKHVAGMDAIPANCIGRMVIAAARMPNVIGALITNYEQYEKDTGKSAPADIDDPKSQKHAG